MNTTTRRYSRSLAEAFPDERAHCIEHYRSPASDLVPLVVGFVLAVSVAVLAFLEIKSRLGV